MDSLEELFCHIDDFCQQFEPKSAILILAKSYSTARNRGMVMPSERAKRARAVERAGFI
jgi:hypothetical protein